MALFNESLFDEGETTRKIHVGYNLKDVQTLLKNSGYEKGVDLLNRIQEIIGFVYDQPEMLDEDAIFQSRQFIYFETKFEESILCYVFEQNTSRCQSQNGNKLDALILAIEEYPIEMLLDMRNKQAETSFFTEWGMVFNMYYPKNDQILLE